MVGKKSSQERCELSQLSVVMFILGHRLRLKMICAMDNQESNVTELTNLLDATQSNVSQHLKAMRKAGIVVSHRRANQVFYSISNSSMFPVIERVQEIFCGTDNIEQSPLLSPTNVR